MRVTRGDIPSPEETKLCPKDGPVAGAAVGFLLVVFSLFFFFFEFLSCLFYIRVLAVMFLVLPSV